MPNLKKYFYQLSGIETSITKNFNNLNISLMNETNIIKTSNLNINQTKIILINFYNII